MKAGAFVFSLPPLILAALRLQSLAHINKAAGEVIVQPAPPLLLQDWLRRQFPKAKQVTLRRMLQDGRVRINGTAAHQMKRALQPDDRIEVTAPRTASKPVASSLHPLQSIYEDDDVLVVNKPAGLLTSTVPRERRPTALAIVRLYVRAKSPQARVGLIHRLDRDASGLLVFSKNEQAYRSLKQQFFEHRVERVYAAVTCAVPTPPAGRIESRLVELPDGSVRTSHRADAGERAVTDYATVARDRGLAALRVTLLTGRKHQIRVHLSERGVPIMGDRVYASKKDKSPRLMLAAIILGFTHPRTGQPVRFELSVPGEFPLAGGKKLTELASASA